MEITLGHTPDADDAFMFYGITSGKVKSSNIKIKKHIVQDIETLNRHALKHELDVTAISAHAYAYLNNYVILRSGGKLRFKIRSDSYFKKEIIPSTIKKMYNCNSW